MNRLLPIEGLRAYLAIWVLIGHVMFFSTDNPKDHANTNMWSSAALFLVNSPYAVNVFMIISGFVIFFLLDKKRETYGQFILRRFFRLYPLYILLLIVAIAINPLEWWTVQHAQRYMTPSAIAYYADMYNTAWKHWGWNLILHLGMFQGAVPNDWLGSTSVYSFLIAAWSIAVEWQFYLLAPFIYMGIVMSKPFNRLGLCIAAILLNFLVWHGFHFEAILPIFIPFFFIGIASYFIYKILPPSPPDTAFPITLGLALFLYTLGNKHEGLIPLVIWIPFFGLLCENPASLSAHLFLVFFNNRLAQFLGAISYGIYLSHELIITCTQYLLITLAPECGRSAHFLALLFLTLLGTIFVSGILHRFIEVPCIELGKKLALRIK